MTMTMTSDELRVDLCDRLDADGAWDWSDGAEHYPSDRVAVVAEDGAWWAVYRGTEGDETVRCVTRAEAERITTAWEDASCSLREVSR